MSQTAELLQQLQARGYRLAVAESLTGGGLGFELTSAPGSSKVLLGSLVAYQTELKQTLLGVSKTRLSETGAVDQVVAAQMATGVRDLFAQKCQIDEARVIGISTTGVAGPDAQDGKPVGTVFVGICGADFETQVLALELDGDRQKIRADTVKAAIDLIWEQIPKLKHL